MPRYIRQKDGFRCVPVAIVNVLKWAGFPVTSADVDDVAREMGATPERGAEFSVIAPTLKARGSGALVIRGVERPYLSRIEEWLRNDGIVLLYFVYSKQTMPEKRYPHCALIVRVSKTGRTFYGVNLYSNTPALVSVRRATLMHELRRRKHDRWEFPFALFIKNK